MDVLVPLDFEFVSELDNVVNRRKIGVSPRRFFAHEDCATSCAYVESLFALVALASCCAKHRQRCLLPL